MVAQGGNAHQVMMELGNNVGGGCWKEGEEKITRRGGAVGRATCCSDKDLERSWVGVSAWGFGSELVDAGTGLGYCRILWGNGRVWGGDKGRGKRTIFSSIFTIYF